MIPDPLTRPAPPASVAKVLGAYEPALQARCRELRSLIHRVAAQTDGVGPLTETLKWGEIAFLTEATGSGTSLRIGPVKGEADLCGLFVHCQTILIDTFRTRLGAELSYRGNRAIVLPLSGPLPVAPLSKAIALTLTYRRWR